MDFYISVACKNNKRVWTVVKSKTADWPCGDGVCNFVTMDLSGVLTFSTFPSGPSDEGPFFTLLFPLSLSPCLAALPRVLHAVCDIISVCYPNHTDTFL